MPERWERQLQSLHEARAPESIDARVKAGPRGTGDGMPPARQRVAAGVVAIAVFVAAGAFAWRALDEPSGSTASPAMGEPDVIEVTEPIAGAEVTSPVTIAGSAVVYEGTVRILVIDEAGNRIANTFATTTCAGGCRGDFSVEVPYSVDRTQAGTIVLFEESAADGTRMHTVRIPVLLGG